MRSRCISMVTALIMIVTTILMAGCGGKSFDINRYIDTCWTQENTDWSKKGYILHIYQEGDKVLFNLSYLRGEPNPKHTNTIAIKKLSEITSNEIDLYFTNDSWGKSGDIKLVFNGDKIEYTISNVKGGEDANWGFINDKGTLVKNMNAESELQMHNEQQAETVQAKTIQTQPSRITSSKILASIGMTEEQFKKSCIRINDIKYGADILYSDILQYPDKYINLYCNDPNLYIREKSETSDGYPAYVVMNKFGGNWRYNVEIFDMRDNTRSPNLSKGACINPYMVFKGVSHNNGNDWLVFHMISVDFDGGMKTVY